MVRAAPKPPRKAVKLFKRKDQPLAETARSKAFRIELGWRGMFGLVVVCFCLFLWMFLLGLWAGQTILLPPRPVQTEQANESPKTFSSSGPMVEDGSQSRQQRIPAP